MSQFHNTPEAEKLATAWHTFALFVSLAEFCGGLYCLGLAQFLRFSPAPTVAEMALLLGAAGVAAMVCSAGQIVFHIKGIFDHVDHRKQLERKKRMEVIRGTQETV